MDELSSAPPKRVTLAPRLGYEDSPREDAALVLEDAAQSRVTLAPRGEPLKENALISMYFPWDERGQNPKIFLALRARLV